MKRLMAVMMFAALVGCGGSMDQGTSLGDQGTQQDSVKKGGGSGGSKSGSGSTSSSTVTTALRTTSDTSMSASCSTWESSFPIFTTSAVYFAFDIKASSGHHAERLDLYDARGSLYQEIQVNFAAGVTASTSEQSAQALGGGYYRIWASLPVSGTAIDQGMMTGTWSANAFLDSARSANATESFDLN